MEESPRSNQTPQFLDCFFGFVSAAGDPERKKEETANAAYECQVALLDAVRVLLRSVPSAWTLRQLLVQVLRHIPVKSYLEEPLADLVQSVKDCDLVQTFNAHRVNVLDTPCGWLADQVSSVHFLVSGDFEREFDRLDLWLKGRRQRSLESTDGPTAAGGFSWRGQEYRFSRREGMLLAVLWNQGPVEEEMVRNKLQLKKHALSQLQHLTQKKLDSYRLPFKIIRPRPLYLELQETPLTKL
jgi:hypothetical protein